MATAALLLEEVSVEELEVALAAGAWLALEVTLAAGHEVLRPMAEGLEAHSQEAHLRLVQDR